MKIAVTKINEDDNEQTESRDLLLTTETTKSDDLVADYAYVNMKQVKLKNNHGSAR